MKTTFMIRFLAVAVLMAVVPIGAIYAQSVDSQSINSINASSFEIPNSLGIKMVRIEKGQFTMGSPADEPGRSDDETQHNVTISKPFYMSEAEITQEQYIPVVIPKYKPFFYNAAAYGFSLPEVDQGGPFNTNSRLIVDSSKYPMDGVVWDKAVEFCTNITDQERKAGRLPAGYVYRLPTEAEWEYCCRAGTKGKFNVDGQLETFAVALGKETSSAVKGERKSNAFGLYDMHGNAYEWCLDWYAPYQNGSLVDPVGPQKGDRRVARGGCYMTGKLDSREPNPPMDQRCLRSAYRGKFMPDMPLPIIGFRIVLAPEIPMN